MIRLRPADESDWARLFAWRNDPLTRAMFNDSEPVPLKSHLTWLAKTLKSDKHRLYIANDPTRSVYVGTVRLDLRERGDLDWAEVSITIDPGQRGRGYAEQVLTALIDVSNQVPLTGLIANIKVENAASLRAFAEVGFSIVKISETIVSLERELGD